MKDARFLSIALPRQTRLDQSLIAAGVGIAMLSTAFAVAMVFDSARVPTFPGAEHLGLFAQPAVRSRPIYAAIDPAPTGSIERKTPTAPMTESPALAGFSTHGLVDGKVMVHGPDGFTLAAPGVDLGPRAGRVLATGPSPGGFSVATTLGRIDPMR